MAAIRSTWMGCLAALCCAVGVTDEAAAEAILIGPCESAITDTLSNSYDPLAAEVVIGEPGNGIDVRFGSLANRLAVVLTAVPDDIYHHVHIVEHWHIAGQLIHDWRLLLGVYDGQGGWVASGNGDDLWFSARAGVTPQPLATPEPTQIEIVNRPDDVIHARWADGLDGGTQLTLDFWVTVPAGMESFVILQCPTTPEPATAALLAAGLGAMLLRRRTEGIESHLRRRGRPRT